MAGSWELTGSRMHEYIIDCALNGAVTVLTGGNRFALYDIAYDLYQYTDEFIDLLENRVFLYRADTCYQVLDLLQKTPHWSVPTLISDMLVTFDDESVREEEVDQLLAECLEELHRLKQNAPVLVSAQIGQRRQRLLKALLRAADEVQWLLPKAEKRPIQPRLIE